MANNEQGMFTQEAEENDQESGKLNRELNEPSPSQVMLERLKEIRKWQEKYREKLVEVQSCSLETSCFTSPNTHPDGSGNDFSSQTTNDSTYFHPKYLFEKRDDHKARNTARMEQETLVVASPSGSLPETTHRDVLHKEREEHWIGCKPKHFSSQYAINVSTNTAFTDAALATWPPLSNVPIVISPYRSESSVSHDASEDCQAKSIKDYEKQGISKSPVSGGKHNSLPSSNVKIISNNESPKSQAGGEQMENVYCGNLSLENKCEDSLELEEVYHAEKYKSGPEENACFKKSNDNINRSKFIPPTRNPVIHCALECDAKDKPKHEYLRKGEGTARFGMNPIKLKRKTSLINYKNSDLENRVKNQEFRDDNQGSASIKMYVASANVNYIKKTCNRPINQLHLKKIPNTAVKSLNEAECTEQVVMPDQMCHTSEEEYKSAHPCSETLRSFKEQEELSAFEKLEELAADSSFSSNSSTVWHLLQRGQHSLASTPLHSASPLTSPKPPKNNHDMVSKRSLFQPNTASKQLLDLLLKSSDDSQDSSSCKQQTTLNVNQILEQLRNIIKLKEHDVSEADIQTFIESFVDEYDAASRFASSIQHAAINATSTPALAQDLALSKPHVRFRNEGQVLEYEPSENDDENTLTDAPTLTEEDSDLVTTSDMEALVHLNMREPLIPLTEINDADESEKTLECSTDDMTCNTKCSATSMVNTKEQRQTGLQPVALHFSPPEHRSNCASNYIWSIFGKDSESRKCLDQKKASNKAEQVEKGDKNKSKHKEADKLMVSKLHEEQACAADDIDTYKTLLLAKVCELEKETEIFKREKSKLQKLQQLAIDEKKQLTEEKHKLQEELAKEKKRLQEYIDNERNAVWREKQELKHQAPSITMANKNSLEVVYLKEQIHDLQEKEKKKESLHLYSVKKFNEKIKNLEDENTELKKKIVHLQNLEKENLQLKHKLDRAKLSNKKDFAGQAANPVREKSRPKPKAATIDSINRSLERLAKHKSKDIGINDRQNNPVTQNTQCNNIDKDPSTHEPNLASLLPSKEQIQLNLNEPCQGRSEDVNQVYMPSSFPESFQNILETDNTTVHSEGKNSEFTESFRDDGTKEIVYANGNKKEMYSNGLVVFSYYNGDRKEIHEDRIIYVYGSDHTSHTTFDDGKEILIFPSGQTETRLPDGSSEIIFADGSRKVMHQDGTEVCHMKDGTVVRSNSDGTKVFEFVSGQREIHTTSEKRREYPDGTVKILHPDGRTETRYTTGRVRIKDRQGNIILDSHQGLP